MRGVLLRVDRKALAGAFKGRRQKGRRQRGGESA
jgi:hypothetical protein